MTNTIGRKITLVRNSRDEIVSTESVCWAIEQLAEALENKWFRVDVVDELQNSKSVLVIEISENSYITEPESFVIEKITGNGNDSLIVSGADSAGIIYGLLELADIVKHNEDPLENLLNLKKIEEKPSNPIRSIKRLFANEKTDKLWFYDKAFWKEYLSELASQRFNRFSLALGMGYDLGHDPDIKDFYFCFAYPFLVDVKGYDVGVEGLPAEERMKNLEMLRYIGQEAKRRGLHFQVGLWTHAYEVEDSPNIQYRILGLNEYNHASYCRDALNTLLKSCPEIDGVTIRIHYESGIPEPAHLFWKVVLKGVASCGRQVKLDLHPKGMYDELLQVADENGVPYTLSPKFWAEHMGLPYHQTAIRETELPVEPTPEAGKMIVTTTSRRFTRYGYADFFKEDRNYDVFFRIWPGTQRVLLWGDPEMAAEYGRAGGFLGAKGIELMEPLSFKSRKTSQTSMGRDPYQDASLRFGTRDWKKYLYSYRLWGRLLYNPDTNPEAWRRYLRNEFSSASDSCEQSLKYASRILPLVTVAHSPSVANNNYWPEIYSNIFIVDREDKPEYHCDGREPATFNAASPLDSELFYRIDEFADAMIDNNQSGKITPLQTANLLEKNALLAEEHFREALKTAKDKNDPTFRRWMVDVQVQIGLGLFFANKFRAGTAYAFFEKVGDPELLENALTYYRISKDAWLQIVKVTKEVYTDDITFGYVPFMRGHWADRVPGIEEDIIRMEQQKDFVKSKASAKMFARAKSWLANTELTVPFLEHIPPTAFTRGENIQVSVTLPESSASVRLHYRHANQSESYQSIEMKKDGNHFVAEITKAYTDSPYPIVYYFQVEDDQKRKHLYPGFSDNLCNQPYFVIRQTV